MRLFPAVIPLALLAAAGRSAGAAEAPVEALPEEIVVAGYRPAAVQELDTSVTMLDAATLDTATLANFEDVVRLIPNMNLSGEGSRARYFQLRGIGEREQYEGAPNPSVGFIVDDIDLSGIGGITSTFDLEQVDVLRGPQSARYGSSALAGMVYVQTAQATEIAEGRVQLTGGSNTTRIVGFAAGGPLGERTAGRISVHRYRDDGFRRNAFLGRDDTNRRDELTVRGKLRWELGDSWQIRLSGLHADFDNGYDAFALDNGPVTLADEPGQDRQQTAAGALRIEGLLDTGVRLVSITAAADSEIVFSFDGDWVNEQTFLPIVYDFRYRNPRDRATISQELRMVSTEDSQLFGDTTDWVVGVFAQRLDESNAIDSTGDYIETAVGCDPGVCFADRQISSQFESRTMAIFAGFDTRFTRRLTGSAGIRLERWSARYTDTVVDNVVAPGVTVRNRFSPVEPLLGGHLSLAYDWSGNTQSYVRLARGFKAGGFNPSLAALGGDPANFSYDPEALWNLELGLKGQLADGRFGYDLAVFGMLRDDAQLSQSSQAVANDPNTFVFTTDNGAARAYGLEAAATWRVAYGLDLHASLGLLDTRIERWEVRPEVEGRDLAHAPSYTANLGFSWAGPSGWAARFDVTAIDGFFFDISNDQRQPAYRLANVRVAKTWRELTLSLWARNLFDEDYATRGFFFGNEPPAFAPALYTRFGDPRQLGLTLEWQF